MVTAIVEMVNNFENKLIQLIVNQLSSLNIHRPGAAAKTVKINQRPVLLCIITKYQFVLRILRRYKPHPH